MPTHVDGGHAHLSHGDPPALARRHTHLRRPTRRCPRALDFHAHVPYHISPMCGRTASFLPAEFIARAFVTVNPLPNLAPSMDAPVVRDTVTFDWTALPA